MNWEGFLYFDRGLCPLICFLPVYHQNFKIVCFIPPYLHLLWNSLTLIGFSESNLLQVILQIFTRKNTQKTYNNFNSMYTNYLICTDMIRIINNFFLEFLDFSVLIFFILQIYYKEATRTEEVCDRFSCKSMSRRRKTMWDWCTCVSADGSSTTHVWHGGYPKP